MDKIAILRARISEIETELRTLHTAAGDDALDAASQARWNGLETEAAELRDALAEREAEKARADNLAASRAKWGTLQVGGSGGADPWRGLDMRRESPAGFISRARAVLEDVDLSDSARSMLAESVAGRDGAAVAQLVVARGNPHYASAFAKVLRSPERAFLTLTPDEAAAFSAVESTRAALSSVSGSAGYTVPLSFDPNLAAIVNDGVASPFRARSQRAVAISSPHRAVTSAGVTAEWVAEGVAWADASPTFGKVDVPLFKLAAYVSASYEVLEDGGRTIEKALPLLLADARNRAEGEAFAVGNGTSAPKGIVTALAAASAFVTATTRGSFTSASSVDTLALFNAIPARARQSKSLTWAMHNVTRTTVATQTVGTAGALLAELTTAGTLLGAPVAEASAMASATTSGNYLAVLADFAKYLIVDSAAGPTMQYVPVIFDATTGTPTGQAGWVYHQRTGADYLDPAQGKILKA